MPYSVENNGKEIRITNNCDYRVVLDCIEISSDRELTDSERTLVTLGVFYDNVDDITDQKQAIEDMIKIVDCGEEKKQTSLEPTPQLEIVDFNKDFNLYVSAINKILGYDIREPRFTHWWTFMSAYREIGEGYFSEVVKIRKKRYVDHKPLDKSEQEFYSKNASEINAIFGMSEEELAYLDEDF